MKHIFLITTLFAINFLIAQELTVTKAYIYHNNDWEVQENPRAVLKRVTFYKENGIGFVFGDGKVTSYYSYKDWNVIANLYNLENESGTIFSIKFNSDRTKVENVFITMTVIINDERLGEVTRKTEFKFDVE